MQPCRGKTHRTGPGLAALANYTMQIGSQRRWQGAEGRQGLAAGEPG